MSKDEKGKRFIDIRPDDNCIILSLWDDGNKICYVPFTVRNDDEKFYKVKTEEGKLMDCFETDFIDEFISNLWEIHDDEMKTNDEVIISNFENAEQEASLYLSVGNGRATINFSMDGSDNIFEIFDTTDKLQSFIFNLEDYVEDIREGLQED